MALETPGHEEREYPNVRQCRAGVGQAGQVKLRIGQYLLTRGVHRNGFIRSKQEDLAQPAFIVLMGRSKPAGDKFCRGSYQLQLDLFDIHSGVNLIGK